MRTIITWTIAASFALANVHAWSTTPLPKTVRHPTALTMSSTTTTDESSTTEEASNKLLQRDRYVATNRFAVRQGKEAKFEKRWATRKSRLSILDGFRYFHLMRRVKFDPEDPTSVYDGGHDGEPDDSQGNYVSFTIWKEKKHFTAWRTGDAFKEAHGGTSIGAFLSTMINSALVLQGPPRPAFYDGLLLQSNEPESVPETEDGWRKIDFPELGIETLPAECFVACNQFYVPRENAAAFEQMWANRKSALKECDGFVAFSMLRRDGSAKGHGTVPVDMKEPTYMSTTIWRDRAAFDAWRTGDAFKVAHGQKKSGEEESEKPKTPPAPLWSKPPTPVFYEGTLVISSEEGA